MNPDQLLFLGYGVLAGLAFAAYLAFGAWRRRLALEAEVKRLREHLNTQMEITQEGSMARTKLLEQLRLENENLRIAVQTWRQKPDRRDLRLLQVYDHAVHQLLERAPGFSTHWEGALREAEEHIAQADRGLIAFTRGWLLPKAPRRRPDPSDEQS
jgi:hypothetical protein